MPNRQQILIVAHPGSACGSADFNLGPDAGEAARNRLVAEVREWKGPTAVIDGELSAELAQAAPPHRQWAKALDHALRMARKNGLLSRRIFGDDNEDFDQRAAAAQLVHECHWSPGSHEFVVTGAWDRPEDGGGCVGSVIETLRERGFQAQPGHPVELGGEDDEPCPGQPATPTRPGRGM